jgi:phosphohistidine phosphatase SixA
LEGLKRINGFITKFLQNRPVTIGFVGHTPNIEALAIYLANNGIVDLEGFEKIGGKSFAEADVMQLKEDKIILPKAE